ncbi:shematrin-like protein 2 [Lutzomyia longipalpis]|uniref:shematrin-like protein 2 n=1 Tax=Lutzomyia longipalpis TaxID=7200 RepID=UPI0024844D34|nr:shematrin-like protein 2 [Lutzomyia longipalpis]
MKNSVCFVLTIFVVVLLVQEVPKASPTPIFFPALSRFISDLKYGADYSGYHGGAYGGYGGPYGSYGGSYGSYGRPSNGGYFGNGSGGTFNRQPDRAVNRQSQGRSYSDICRVFGSPGINTNIPSGTFCPYSG